MSKNKKSVLSDIGNYSIASFATQLITLVAGILTRRFLGPTQMGIWSLLQIIVIYSNYASLGATEAILREIPYYEGRGEKHKVHEIKNQVFSFSMLTAFVISFGVLLYAFIFRPHLSEHVFYGLMFVSALVILQRINNLYISFLRGFKHFTLASTQMIYSSIVNALLVAVLSLRFQMYGFMWALCLSFVFNIVYVHAHVQFGFRWELDWRKVGELIRYGFPLMILSIIDTIHLSIDKIMIAKMVGVTQLGLYTVALLSYSFLGKVTSSVGIVLVPNLHQKYGEREQLSDLRDYIVKTVTAFSVLMPLLIGLGSIWIAYLARFVLPDYLDSIPPMRSLILSAFFLSLFHPFSYLMTVMRKQTWLVPIISLACVLAIVGNFIVLRANWGITAVGMVTTFVFAVKFTIVYFKSGPAIMKKPEVIWLYLNILFKFVFLVAVLVGIWYLMPNAETSFTKSLMGSAVFAVIYLPSGIKTAHELGVLQRLRRKFFTPRMPEDETDHE
jgi:O-antigen/teichoic acid export membrane protein